MKYMLCCAVLCLGAIAVAQQPGQPPTTNPPYQTPLTFPEGRQTPRTQLPPDTQAPPPQSEKVEGQILQQLRSEPALSSTNVDARVDDHSVVLTGTVDTVTQHDLALRIVQANAGDRKIVDRINIKQQT
jgi:hypothetical protein